MDSLERIMAGLAAGDDAMECALWAASATTCAGSCGAPTARLGPAPADRRRPRWPGVGRLRHDPGRSRRGRGRRRCAARGSTPRGGSSTAARPRRTHTQQWSTTQPATSGRPVLATDDPPAVVVLDRLARRGEHPVGPAPGRPRRRGKRPDDHELVHPLTPSSWRPGSVAGQHRRHVARPAGGQPAPDLLPGPAGGCDPWR